MRIFIGLSAAAALLAGASIALADTAPPPSYGLDTPAQIAAEARTIRIMARPEVQAAHRRIVDMFKADPSAATESGRMTLLAAADSAAFEGLFFSINNDPARPEVYWMEARNHEWHGLDVPAGRWGLENPDNIYRIIFIDDAHEYRIHGTPQAAAPGQFFIEMLDSAPGTANNMGIQLTSIQKKDIQMDPDGGFTITVGPKPGGPNHLQSTPRAHALWIRDSLSDWTNQAPYALTVTPVSGPTPAPLSDDAVAQQGAVTMVNFARYWLDFRGQFYAGPGSNPVNDLPQPQGRSGAWGYVSSARFDVPPGKALVVTLNPLGAAYNGFQVGDPWWVAADYVEHTGGRDNAQTKPNADGTLTYVVSQSDPGVTNWIDTDGMEQGILTIRWEAVPGSPAMGSSISPDGLTVTHAAGPEVKIVKESRLVDLSQVKALYPALIADPAAEAAAMAARRAGYERRVRETAR